MAAEFFLSDGIIITGSATGKPASPGDVDDALRSVGIPVLVGSGICTDNFERYMHAHALIVGSYFKEAGRWQDALSLSRIKQFMSALNHRR